jgi:HAD superfamily hydrolase (TIGR01509 family)
MHRHPRPVREYVADYLFSVGRTMSDAEAKAFDDIWRAHDKALELPRPQVVDTLCRLTAAGVRLGLLSNAHEREIREWRTSPLSSYFEVVVFSCHAEMTKPDLAAYKHVLRALGVEALDAVYVGDGASNELRGARDAEFGAVVFMRGLLKELRMRESEHHELANLSDVAVDQLGELADLISVANTPDSNSRLTAGRSRRAGARG